MNDLADLSRPARRNAPSTGSRDNSSNKQYDSHRAAAQMNSQVNQDMEEEFDLKYGAEHVIKLFAPVSLCMLVVVLTISNISFYTKKDVYLIYTPFNETSNDTFTKTWNAVANSLILISVVIIMTMVLICLYKNSFYKVISVWLIFSTVMLMFMFAYFFFEEVLRALNVPIDIFTIVLFIWNFGVTGVMCVHWRGPMRIQQAYLIFISALMALVFIKYMPEWTTWAVLLVISIWDLVAVLTPRGPLRILVETAQERNEAIFPSLIYSAVAYPTVIVTMTENEPERTENNSSPSTERELLVVGASASDSELGESSQPNEAPPPAVGSSRDNITTYASTGSTIVHHVPAVGRSRRHREGQSSTAGGSGTDPPRSISTIEEKEGVKLGLGDFIFYSVLVGKASSYGDWNTTLACFVAILIGLCLTLLLLAAFRKALPALPISITFGLVFYFCTQIFVKQFADMLALNQIFI